MIFRDNSKMVVFDSISDGVNQGWGAGAGCFGSLELEPEPLEKKNSIRKLYFSYSFLGKIVSFYG